VIDDPCNIVQRCVVPGYNILPQLDTGAGKISFIKELDTRPNTGAGYRS
jgi:hypothetical protein